MSILNVLFIYGKRYYACGIIAGNLPLDFYYFLFRGKSNDGKVTVDSTKLEGMQDHMVIKALHWYLSKSKTAWSLTLNFLLYPRFA